MFALPAPVPVELASPLVLTILLLNAQIRHQHVPLLEQVAFAALTWPVKDSATLLLPLIQLLNSELTALLLLPTVCVTATVLVDSFATN